MSSNRNAEKIILITNGNFISMVALSKWLSIQGHIISDIYITKKLPSSRNNWHGVMDMLKKSGVKYTYFKIFVNILLPIYAKIANKPHSVASYIQFIGCSPNIYRVNSINTSDVISAIKKQNPTTIVSFSATERFTNEVVEIPEHGAINVHYGALPKYAGLSPYYWHLHNKESNYGVTMHKITSRLDAGDIIDQRISQIDEKWSALDLALEMSSHVSPMLTEYFDGSEKNVPVRAQDIRERTYFGHPTRAQVTSFTIDGGRFLTFSACKRAFDILDNSLSSGHDPRRAA